MDSFGQLSSQRVFEDDVRAHEGDPSYARSLSFVDVPINLKMPPRVTWTTNEEFFEGHLKFHFYEESGRILSHSEQGRHIKGVFLDKVCVERDCDTKYPVTAEFYLVLKRFLDNRVNWSTEFSFGGLTNFTSYVMEWTFKVMKNIERTLRQADIYGLVAVSPYPYTYHKEVWRAFCELWGPLTNTLHHGGGEMGISLNDLKQIGGLPVLGIPYEEFLPPNEQLIDESRFSSTVLELLQIHTELCRSDSKKEVSLWKWLTHFCREKLVCGAYGEVSNGHRRKRKELKIPQVDPSGLLPLRVSNKGKLAAFIVFLLCRFVLPHGSKAIRPQTFVMACRMAEGTRVSLAPTVLGHIYHGLGKMATHELTPGRANPSFGIHFVVGWLGEYFPCLYTHRPADQFKEKFPLLARYFGMKANTLTIHHARSVFQHDKFVSYRDIVFGDEFTDMERLDSEDLSDSDFEHLLSIRSCLLPVRVGGTSLLEPYYLNRFARQFGLDQGVPVNNLTFSFSQRSRRSLEDIALSSARLFIKNTGAKFYINRSHHLGSCTMGYCKWWVRVSFPYVGQSMDKINVTLTKKDTVLKDPVFVISDLTDISRSLEGWEELPVVASSSSNETPPDQDFRPAVNMVTSKRSARERSLSDDVCFKRATYKDRDGPVDFDSGEKVDYDSGSISTGLPILGGPITSWDDTPIDMSQSDNANVAACEPQPQAVETTIPKVDNLQVVPSALGDLLSLPIDGWIRESIIAGVNRDRLRGSTLHERFRPSEIASFSLWEH